MSFFRKAFVLHMLGLSLCAFSVPNLTFLVQLVGLEFFCVLGRG
jgi:hypothetical protein